MSKNASRSMRRPVVLLLAGLLFLGLAYKFRHRILHFHSRAWFRTMQTITVSPAVSLMPKGGHKRFLAIAHYRDGGQAELSSEVTWTSSNPAVAQIDANGIATAANEGTETFRAAAGHAGATASVTVVPVAAVALAISPTNQTFGVGSNLQLTVFATRSDDTVEEVTKQVNWTSLSPDVVAVSPAGLARGETPGNSTIVAELVTPLGKIRSAARLSVLSTTTTSLAGVFSYRYDASGTGQNRFETALTPKNVRSATFGRLFAAPVDGYVYAQPLYVSHLAVREQGVHNVVYAATENNTIFAIDADSGAELFRTSLGPAVPKDQLACLDSGPQIGITGTPVIDPVTRTLYVAAKTFKDGKSSFYLHAVDIASGKERQGSPVLVSASLPGTGAGSRDGSVTFNATPQLQRPGLVLVGGQVIVGFGSICDSGPFHGWVFAYDEENLTQRGVFLSTPNGSHGGIWQAGGAPAVDHEGNFYVITGDGEFDAYKDGADYGDTFLRLRLDAHEGIVSVDYFTPFDQSEMEIENSDLGSSAPLLLPDQVGPHSHLLFGAAKSGAMYLLDRDDMGHFQASGNNQIVQYIPHVFSSKVHVSPAYWSDRDSEWVYVSSVEGPLQAFPLSRGQLSPISSSQTSTVFGYPGATPVISSHGNADGIVWALENSSGILHAYAATNLSNELYNARQRPDGRDLAEHGVQFYAPMVANGRVYFGTRGHLYAYGLLPKP
jgi:outer membrane protein assembly factor BamB